jgi:uncharacterized glyoxalase superfamily protein PhnB
MIHKTKSILLPCALVVLCLGAIVSPAQSNNPSHSSPTSAANQPQSKKEKPVKFNKVTPNLIVADMEKSLKFYRDVLGFTVSQTVPPDKGPFIFAWMQHGDAVVFLNQRMPPQPGQPDLFAGRQIGGTLSLYIAMEGIDEFLKTVEGHGVKLAVPLHKEFYGMKEFAVYDPDGYLLIFAERVE